MPNIMNQELVRAFNIILCHNEVAITNLTVQSTDQTFFKKEDRIVISFDKSMDADQCMKYLNNMKGRIVETFCGNESTASLSFDMKSFPFNFNRSQLVDSNGKYRFSVPIDQSIVFNLKCLLANGLARDITGAMGRDFGLEHVEGYTSDESFDRKSYLYCMRFYDKRLQEYFIESFSATVKGYKNSPKRTDGFLKVKDNCVYIKGSIFNKAKFIKDIVKHKASLECRDFEVTSAEDETVENLKFSVIDLSRKVGIPINSVLHVSYTGSGENSVLIPAAKEIIDNIIYYKILSKEQADDINKVFGMTVLNNVEDCISPKHLPVFGRRGIYGIDFANQDISYCVLNKIMESSVINKDHELSIDPELPRTLLAEPSPTRGCPKQSRGEGLERPSRQGSEREEGKGGLFQLVPGEIDPSQSTCSLRAWDSSTFLNSEVSNKEPEKQQVTDESDRKSSNECSEAKSQDSKSPEKKHGGGVQKIKKLLSSPFKKQYGVNLKRHDEGRDTTRSTPETPVTEKPLLSKRSASERRAKNNPPSGVTSPVTEPDDGGFRNRPRIRVLRSETNGGIPEPLPQDAVSKPNVPGDRNSKISKDSGLGSLERGQSPPLTEEFSDSSQQNLSIGVKLGNMLSELLNSAQNLLKNPASSTHRGVPGGPKRQASLTSSQRQELRKVLSPEMRKKLDANFFPPGYEKLLHLLYVDSEGLCSLLSSPEAKEQVCSVLPPEEKEQVQSGSPEEIVRLLHKFFSNQKISDNCLLSSKIDSPKIKKLLQEEIFV
ncbi:hypothetical protein [Wolbachia endosymbiont of Drosophila barbarae]|uniref:hypothetical protein n=2 Tax=Wolbachia endosymbiont of Drosophila barbarae TaxID=3377043 RepID=UPI0038103BA5